MFKNAFIKNTLLAPVAILLIASKKKVQATPVEPAGHVQQYANMWRTVSDF